MSIDRSKFKPSSVTKMQDDDAALNSTLGRDGSRAGMHKITVGKNVFRIYPAHPEESLSEDEQPGFSQPSVKTFLPMMVDEKDDKGNLTGKKKEGNKPIFNSRIHGGTEKDLVEEYIKFARKVADEEIEDKGDKQKYLDKLYGKYSKVASERLMGIGYKTGHVMYADKIIGEKRTFGRVEVKDSVKTRLNQIAAIESEGEALGVDPYTDLDEGRAIVIIYDDKATQAANYYAVTLDTDIDKVSKMIKFYPITDELLEEFEKQPSLYSMYQNVFKRKDFDLQLEGLAFFDKKNKMGIFGREEWDTVVAEISDYYSGEEEEEIEEAEEEAEEQLDEFATMSRIQLKAYIAKNSLGIIIKPSYTEEVIANLIREKLSEKEEPEEEAEELDEVEQFNEVIEENKAAPPVANKSTSRLSSLRKKSTS